MLLQILRTLEGLSTEVTFVRLQRNVDSDVGSDMITLDSGSSARVPSTGEVQVICALSSDMFLADMFLTTISLAHLPLGTANSQKEPPQKNISQNICPIDRRGCRRPQLFVSEPL